jgi:hypothetical protein
MGLKLRNNSVAEIMLLGKLIRSYMYKNNVPLKMVDEEFIQKRFDEILDKMIRNNNER